MNKGINRFFTALALTAGFMVAVACGQREKQAEPESDDVEEIVAEVVEDEALEYATVNWRDSVKIQGGSEARVAFSCVYPTNTDMALADSMRQWVLRQFGDSLYSPTKDIRKAITTLGKKALRDDSRELAEFVEEGGDELGTLAYERDTKTKVIFENRQYVTMQSEAYLYTAGAHGSTYVDYVTFRKSDGHIMGWNLLRGMSREAAIKAIKKGLMGYFEVGSREELLECLLLYDENIDDPERIFDTKFPLPSTPPYLTKAGVCVIYQQYEIAPYSAGHPTCVVIPRSEGAE